MKDRHGNCVGANTKAEAQVLFDNIKELEEQEKQEQISNEEIIKNLRQKIAEYEAEKLAVSEISLFNSLDTFEEFTTLDNHKLCPLTDFFIIVGIAVNPH